MTTSGTATFNPSCDDIMRSALQLAGLLPLGRSASAQQLQHARFFLDEFFKSQGASLMQMERETLTLAAGIDTYDLAADTIGVTFPMMCLPLPQQSVTQSQTQIQGMSFDQYQQIPDKTQQGVPIRCYSEKLALVTLRFWPVPNAAFTVSYQRQRLMEDAASGATVDRPPRWMRGISFMMAHDMALAGSLPLDRVKYLGGMAEDLLRKAEGMDHEDVNEVQFLLDPL